MGWKTIHGYSVTVWHALRANFFFIIGRCTGVDSAQERSVRANHYLHDFLTLGQADSNQCSNNLSQIQSTCEWLGIPLKWQKIEGPYLITTYLGIELDTRALEARLPRKKLEGLMEELQKWEGRKACQKRVTVSDGKAFSGMQGGLGR